MRTQQDSRIRVVALANLEAMCQRQSGVCHRFWIEKVTRSRIWIGLLDPNRTGQDAPSFAVLPCFPGLGTDTEPNPRVVLEPLRIVNDPRNYQGLGYQLFEPLWDCPKLWRHFESGEWATDAEWKARTEWYEVE